jgi:hypothetical protein
MSRKVHLGLIHSDTSGKRAEVPISSFLVCPAGIAQVVKQTQAR